MGKCLNCEFVIVIQQERLRKKISVCLQDWLFVFD